MTEEKLQLRYIDDTRKILQMWVISPYVICLVMSLDGTMYELIIEDQDEYI